MRRFLIAVRRSTAVVVRVRSAPRGQLRIRSGDGLVESQRLDVAAEFSQRVKPFRRAGAGIAYEIIETIFPGDDDEMRDATT